MTTTFHRRRLDERGRLTLPAQFRNAFNLEKGDEFDFFHENDLIIIKKKLKSLPTGE